jgi:outer membrane protein assembly factor BamB
VSVRGGASQPHVARATALLGVAVLVLSVAGTVLVLGASSPTPAVSSAAAPQSGATSSLPTNAGDWPTYLQNPTRTSSNLVESTLSSANAKKFATLWSYKTGNVISGSTTVVGNVAYVGSWNGYEYALNASTGALLWKSFLGTTGKTECGTQGIASSATVQSGTLYIGGGDGNWYVLNAATGAVEWKVLVGNPANGYYNWASPLLYDGFAYVGISSFCDMPLVPGGLLQINLTTHLVQHQFNTTAPGVLGSSVWGSPSVDAQTNTIYFATGNNYPKQAGAFSDSVVAVNASDVSKLVSSWTIPAPLQVPDGDFGSSATLFSSSTGTTMMGALDKNGYFYAFNAGDLAAGPVWDYKITTGQAVGSAAFAQGLVFVAAGTADYKGTHSSGAAWAFNPTTGAVVWEQPLWGKSVSAPAYANGLVLVDGGNHVFVLNATTGAKLKELPCGSTFYSPPAIAHGRIFVGCTSGQEFAFGLPSSATPTSSAAGADGLSAVASLTPADPDGIARWV